MIAHKHGMTGNGELNSLNNVGCLKIQFSYIFKCDITSSLIRAIIPLFPALLTHLFLVHTLPGPRHHLDIPQMLPKYHQSSVARWEMKCVSWFNINIQGQHTSIMQICAHCFMSVFTGWKICSVLQCTVLQYFGLEQH